MSAFNAQIPAVDLNCPTGGAIKVIFKPLNHSETTQWTHRGPPRLLLRKKKGDLTDADHDHIREVVGYVHRHLAQRPQHDVEHTKLRSSLMNWGHDPLKG
ncbi:DUF3140 domain-containing protein [Actinokineospora terrae]|uniref:DUF3140 domain-containing protein n=1 Tax=Actinokineospora terrae TaxID=155974 RepID=A0A1H9T3I7_9PSEU|nr:DUF3140 domain-containing protein [Actinokineospora terrae]SER91564.1 Protein of unknown function [Actinokineospora terrae]